MMKPLNVSIANTKKRVELETMCNIIRAKNKLNDNKVFLNPGTIDYFLNKGAPSENSKPAENPIAIKMPNGTFK